MASMWVGAEAARSFTITASSRGICDAGAQGTRTLWTTWSILCDKIRQLKPQREQRDAKNAPWTQLIQCIAHKRGVCYFPDGAEGFGGGVDESGDYA